MENVTSSLTDKDDSGDILAIRGEMLVCGFILITQGEKHNVIIYVFLDTKCLFKKTKTKVKVKYEYKKVYIL